MLGFKLTATFALLQPLILGDAMAVLVCLRCLVDKKLKLCTYSKVYAESSRQGMSLGGSLMPIVELTATLAARRCCSHWFWETLRWS